MTPDLTAMAVANQDPAPIVVGVDGGAASLAALRWAAAEAAAHGVQLVALHVHDPRNRRRAAYVQAGSRDVDPDDRLDAIERLIESTLTASVERLFEVGVPSEVLVRRAAGARMLVLGQAEQHRRHDGEPFRHEPALGAVARACVARAVCPVVVVSIPAQSSVPAGADPAPSRIPELAGSRAIYPRVRATSVIH
jgi:nucleotide-binding universal stress UspA family protein